MILDGLGVNDAGERDRKRRGVDCRAVASACLERGVALHAQRVVGLRVVLALWSAECEPPSRTASQSPSAIDRRALKIELQTIR